MRTVGDGGIFRRALRAPAPQSTGRCRGKPAVHVTLEYSPRPVLNNPGGRAGDLPCAACFCFAAGRSVGPILFALAPGRGRAHNPPRRSRPGSRCGFVLQRKVRAPQGRMPANGRASRGDGSVQQKVHRHRLLAVGTRASGWLQVTSRREVLRAVGGKVEKVPCVGGRADGAVRRVVGKSALPRR